MQTIMYAGMMVVEGSDTDNGEAALNLMHVKMCCEILLYVQSS